jgi:hypothetical protein
VVLLSNEKRRMSLRIPIVLSLAVLGAAVCASSASAQGRAMRGSAPAPARIGSFRAGAAGFEHARPRRVFRDPALLPYPYFYSGYGYSGYGDDEYEPLPPEAPPVQVVLVQKPAPSSAAVATPIEPLVLEYHDGRWVRVTTDGQPSDRAQPAQPAAGPASSARAGTAPSPSSAREATQPLPELPPAVLVFRDGHREGLTKYTIKGDVIYASADYWSTGSWTREIPVAALDIPTTLKLNAESGAKFALPSGPNEIVMRF